METIHADLRSDHLKPNQLRRAGFVPCVIYGGDLKESLPIQIPSHTARQIKRTMRQGSPAEILLEGKRYRTRLDEMDYRLMKDEIIHISFVHLQ